MRYASWMLIVAGIIGLITGGLDYRRTHRTVHVGPLTATIQERETNPEPPILGGLALLAGVALVAGSHRARV